MPALTTRATPVRNSDLALVRVLEASIEILKIENEILRRRLAAAETWAAEAAIAKRLDTRAERNPPLGVSFIGNVLRLLGFCSLTRT